MFLSHKETQRLLQGKPFNNSSGKYYKNCRKNNHNTNKCSYMKRSEDTGQRDKQIKGVEYKTNRDSRSKFCGYRKKTNHTVEECYKKKNADTRKANESQPITSVNGMGPGSSGIRPVRELKIMAQDSKCLLLKHN